MTTYDLVVPTVGRPSLDRLLRSLVDAGARPGRVVVVDDRRAGAAPLAVDTPLPVTVVHSGGRGPAAARNTGVAALGEAAPWIVFLDDDVEVEPGWGDALAADLEQAHHVATVSAVITVPLPSGRRPTDWERNTARLERARDITADMAVRREAFDDVGGFDERFPRAYREDSDLVLRLRDRGWRGAQGSRRTRHPVRPAGFFASVRQQAGNADHARMRRRHGRDYRRRLGEGRDSWPGQLLTTLAAVAAPLLWPRRRRLAALAAAVWLVSTLRFAWARVQPGPRDPAEVARMGVTSALIPPVAVAHRAAGWVSR